MQQNLSDPVNIRFFNLTVGLIFNYLYSEFPVRQTIYVSTLGDSFEEILESPEAVEQWSGDNYRYPAEKYILHTNIPAQAYIDQTLQWLRDEGFVRSAGDHVPVHQLTTKTLAILNGTPKAVGEKTGVTLSTAVKAARNESGRAAIGEIVGQIIGAAARTAGGG